MKHRYLKNVTTLKLDDSKCTGCGICYEVCPHNIILIENNRASIKDKDSCIECGACMKNCPFHAITVDAGTGCAYAVIRSLITGGKPSCLPKSKNGNDSCC